MTLHVDSREPGIALAGASPRGQQVSWQRPYLAYPTRDIKRCRGWRDSTIYGICAVKLDANLYIGFFHQNGLFSYS